MNLLSKTEIYDLIKDGSFLISSTKENNQINFLDDIRLGLSVEKLFEVEPEVDLLNVDKTQKKEITINPIKLQKSNFYLGISGEKFSLPNNVIGLINTRSKYARIGIDVVNSSFLVIPGFGNSTPTPIVFEITTQTNINNFVIGDYYAYAIFFQIDNNVNLNSIEKEYEKRFPFE
jgi:deoxycytidine triphosphate deaminase